MVVKSLAEIHISYVSSFSLINIPVTVKKEIKLIHFKSVYLLIAHSVLDTLLGIGNTEMNKI